MRRSKPRHRPSFAALVRGISICVLALCGLACVPLQGIECRQDSDCDTSYACRKGWCHPTPTQVVGGLTIRHPLPLPPSLPRTFMACPNDDARVLNDPLRIFTSGQFTQARKPRQSDLSHPVSDGEYLYFYDRVQMHLARIALTRPQLHPEILLREVDSVQSLIADKKFLYASVVGSEDRAFSGGILRLPKAGGDPIYLAWSLYRPKDLVQDAKYIYWNTAGLVENTQQPKSDPIFRVAKDGGEPEIIAEDNRPYALAIDGTHLYWITSEAEGKLRRRRLPSKSHPNPPVETLKSRLRYARDLALDKRYIYLLTDAIWRFSKQEIRRQPERISPPLYAGTRLLIDGWFAYITTDTSLLQIPLRCTGTKGTFNTRLAGPVASVATDATHVYLLLKLDGPDANAIYKAKKRPPSQWFTSP